MTWFKSNGTNVDRIKLENEDKYSFYNNSNFENVYFNINDVEITDSAVYFCKVNDTWGPGTEINVVSK